jgi:hypothetical protein
MVVVVVVVVVVLTKLIEIASLLLFFVPCRLGHAVEFVETGCACSVCQ